MVAPALPYVADKNERSQVGPLAYVPLCNCASEAGSEGQVTSGA